MVNGVRFRAGHSDSSVGRLSSWPADPTSGSAVPAKERRATGRITGTPPRAKLPGSIPRRSVPWAGPEGSAGKGGRKGRDLRPESPAPERSSLNRWRGAPHAERSFALAASNLGLNINGAIPPSDGGRAVQ